MMENVKVGLFYGSDTGNTDVITEQLVEKWTFSELEEVLAENMTVEDFDRFDVIVLGLSTWYDGDLQSDFEIFFDDFKTVDFTGKIVALYGLGDQYGYAEYFVDGLGILGEEILKNGGKIVGMWPNDGYEFIASKGLYQPELFYGLALDEDNQMELSEERIDEWLLQLEVELPVALKSLPVVQK